MLPLEMKIVSAILLLTLCVAPCAGAEPLSKVLQAEGAASLAKAAEHNGNAARGAILFHQRTIECAKCHSLGGQELLGPDLTKIDKKTTAVNLVESILLPSKVIKEGFESVSVMTKGGKVLTGRIVKQKPNELILRQNLGVGALLTLEKSEIDEVTLSKSSLMPDGLVDQLNSRQQFLDLVKYTMNLVAHGPRQDVQRVAHVQGGGVVNEDLQGLVLMDELNCTSCHAGQVSTSSIPPKQAPDLRWARGRIRPSYIEHFLLDPQAAKPGTTMPDVLASLDEPTRRTSAKELTHYLLSLRQKPFVVQALDRTAARRGRELFHTVGCVACHSPREEDGSERFESSSNPLGKLEDKYNLVGLVDLLKNPHAVRPSGRMPNMKLTHWEALDIANYLLMKTDLDKVARFEVDRTLAAKGSQQFTQLGCSQCHKNIGTPTKVAFPSLNRLRLDRGCLSNQKGAWPQYRLTKAKKSAIRAALQRPSNEVTDEEQISLTLATFNCVACHQRGELGGVSPKRNDYFHTTNENLGEQGRIPPPLTGVGAKLTPKWMRAVLVSGKSIRPYMKTRMPQYGKDNVVPLVELFSNSDRLAKVEYGPVSDQKAMRQAGVALVGSTGLNCIACHTFQHKRSETMPGVDLTEMAERLEKKWFYHYMLDPQRFSQNTVMPSFWPGHRAIRRDILAGDTKLQIEALWQYLLDGRQARIPRGVIRKPIELLASDEAVMLRRSYSGIGKRGIGVGYPNAVNLAFDAEQMRLAMIWKGKFADPGGVWRGQGSGTVRPLGTDLLRFPRGPELDDATKPWQVDEGRPPQHRFKGYYLDKLRRPTFLYRFDTVDVEDYVVDVEAEQSGEGRFLRTLSFSSETGRKNVVFRIATSPSIVPKGNNSFSVGKTLRVRIDTKHRGQIVEDGDEKQLLIPLELGKGKTTLILEYSW